MREITSHIVDGDQAPQLRIAVVAQPSPAGGGSRYDITSLQMADNPCYPSELGDYPTIVQPIVFQCVTVPNKGLNGVTNEALLAIVADQLECFQNGPYPSQENATALQNVKEALRALQKRTMARIRRGVEGQQIA
jgi:hypothetical protein